MRDPHSGEFLKIDRSELEKLLRLNTLAHLDIAHHFGQRLAKRGQGGLLLVGAMGSGNGVPYMANDGAAKRLFTASAKRFTSNSGPWAFM